MTHCQRTIISIKVLLSLLQIIITSLLWDLLYFFSHKHLIPHCVLYLSGFCFLACCSWYSCSQVAFYFQPPHTFQSSHTHFLLCLSLPIPEITPCHCPPALCTGPVVLIFTLNNIGRSCLSIPPADHFLYSFFFHPPRNINKLIFWDLEASCSYGWG